MKQSLGRQPMRRLRPREASPRVLLSLKEAKCLMRIWQCRYDRVRVYLFFGQEQGALDDRGSGHKGFVG